MPSWDAFVSYNSRDAATASRVQRALERYRLPGGRRLRVYRDETDISGGELPAQLREALAASRCLVVCCSRAAVESAWVDREIDAFREQQPDRPILPVLVADEPPDNIPAGLSRDGLRWADLRAGWRLGRPRRQTRVELVRVIAAVADLDFRVLLPLDQRRRRLAMLRAAGLFAVVGAAGASVPVNHWVDATPGDRPLYGCDLLDDGIVLYHHNEPQAIKDIVDVRRDAFGTTPRRNLLLDGELVPRGRLLPARTADGVRRLCGGGPAEWIGEPEPGTCVRVRESETIEFFADPMGGFEASLTDVLVNDVPFELPFMWRRLNVEPWQEYGRTRTPSAGLPIAARVDEIWLGFSDSETTRGILWHTTDRGASWNMVPGISDVRSVRRLSTGLLVAGRLDRELGFWFTRDSVFTALDVPGKGEDLEVCGEVAGQPVVRADRNLFRRVRWAWWRTQLAGSSENSGG